MQSGLPAWLATSEGERLLDIAVSLPADRLTRITRLRKICSPDIAAAVVELLELRAKGANKFSAAQSMLFTAVGLEQSTGERVAKYRASRFPQQVPILDACCGIGGDAMQLARRCPVLSVDSDYASCACTRHNCSLAADSGLPAHTLCADITRFDLARARDAGIRAAFFDPGRRRAVRTGQLTRTRNTEEYSPPLSWMAQLIEVFETVCVKVSPFLDDFTLKRSGCTVEFVSDRGECKEALLWSGMAEVERTIDQRGDSLYSAVVIDAHGAVAILSPSDCPRTAVGALCQWIYEPDAAVVRAHLTDLLAAQLQSSLLHESSYYLASDVPISTPFATRYRLLDSVAFHPSAIQARCVQLGRSVTAVKTRWNQIDPSGLIKRIPGAGKGADPVTIIITRVGERTMALICEVALDG